MSCSNRQQVTDEMKISSFNLGDTTLININDIVLCNDDLALFVQFDSVIEDSRCPYNSNCIWEGNAELAFSITYKKELQNITLNTSKKMGKTKSVYGFTFEIISLDPYPGTMNAAETPASTRIRVTKD